MQNYECKVSQTVATYSDSDHDFIPILEKNDGRGSCSICLTAVSQGMASKLEHCYFVLCPMCVCANESIQDDLMTLTYPLMSQLTALLGRNLSLPFNFISSSLLLLLYLLI